MNYLYALITVLCSLFGFTLRYFPFRSVIAPEKKKVLFLVYAILSAVHFAVLSVIYGRYGITLDMVQLDGVVFTMLLLVDYLILIPGRWREHMFVYGVVVTCSYMVMSVPVYVSALYFGGAVNMWTMGLYGVLLVLVYFPLKKLLETTVTPFLFLDSGNYWRTVWFIPVSMFLAMYFICPGGEHKDTINHLVSHGLIAAATITMCWSIAADHNRMKASFELEEQLNLQKNHYAQLETRVNDARKLAHDFKHHVSVIQHYLDTDDREGLQEYCWEMGSRPIQGVRIPYTGNGAVDGVLYRYAQLALERNTDFTYVGSVGACAISNMDLSVLIGNALENALTGCMTLEEGRKIQIVMQSEEKMVSILVHNTFDGVVQQKGDVLYSRKRENEPGVGMSSMQSICDKNGVEMNIQWDESSFTVLFMIPMQKQN